MGYCYICNEIALSKECPGCNKPVCKNCMKSFPFSDSLCFECASNVKVRLGGLREDEEVF